MLAVRLKICCEVVHIAKQCAWLGSWHILGPFVVSSDIPSGKKTTNLSYELTHALCYSYSILINSLLLTSRYWCVDASCYCPHCWSSIKVSMATRSGICLKENSGRFSSPERVGCKPHLFILSTYIFTLLKCLCSSYVHHVHVLTAEESFERGRMGKNSLACALPYRLVF
jgi:hypothetical protein